MMRSIYWLSLLLIPVFVLTGCSPIGPNVQPTQRLQLPSQINSPVPDIVAPTSTPIPAITKTPSPTKTQIPLTTLGSESIKKTVQPLLNDPIDCEIPCFLGITPGKTRLDEIRALFNPLGFAHKEGIDPNSSKYAYSVAYEADPGRSFSVVFYTLDNLVENIVLTPQIIRQSEENAREWIAYTPETMIKKFGKPSRVYFAIELGQVNTTINMLMYFDAIDLIVLYSGYDMIPNLPGSFQFCPFTFAFDHVRLWMGEAPPDPPLFPMLPLEKVTSLTIDQFTQLMMGDPQQACFIVNGDLFR